MNKAIFFILLIIGGFLTSLQAQNYTLSGTVTDSVNTNQLIGATIVLTDVQDAETKHYGVSNNKGEFELQNVQAGNYSIKISYIGYETWHSETAISNSDIDLGKILLSSNSSSIAEIEISEDATAVVQKGDTTQYNAGSYKSNPDANAENLLEKMPGMLVKEGKMQVQGEDVKQVLVDGKQFFGEDPNAALKNIPAEIIQKIQVFDQQSEQAKFTGFDDGNSIKTINIITKVEFQNGTFGNAYAGYGYENKHSAGGVVNVFNGDQRITILAQSNDINQQNFAIEDLAGVMSNNSNSNSRGRGSGGSKGGRPGSSSSGGDVNDFLLGEQDGITSTNAFGINYTDKWSEKIDVNSSYFFNQTKNISNISSIQKFFSNNDAGQEYAETELGESENVNHRLNLKLNYSMNRNNSIMINPKLTLQKNSGFSDLSAQTQLSDELLNSTVNNFYSDVYIWNFSNFLIWRHKFDKRGGSLSMNLSQDLKSNVAESNLEAQNNYYSTLEFDSINQNADLDQFEQTYTARIVYTEPLSKKVNLQFNYSPSFSFNNSEIETYNYDYINDSYSVFDTTLSNSAESNYQVNNIGTGVRLNMGKSMLMFNGSYQLAKLSSNQESPFESVINSSFTSVLPAAMWKYTISDKKNLAFFYRTNTSAPSISQLQEVLDNSNPLQLSIGNADLNQQYNHNIYAKYSSTNSEKNSVFFAMLNASIVNDYIGNNTTIAYSQPIVQNGISLTPGTQLISPQNMDGYYTLKAFSSYGMPIKALKSNLNLNASVNYSHTPGIINEELNLVNTPSYEFGAVISSNISEKLDFTIGSISSMNYTYNTLNATLNSQYFSQASKVRMYWNFWRNMSYKTELQHHYYAGFSDDYNTNYLLWNMSIGTKLFKNKQGQLEFSIYDVLDQNNSISRTNTETYIQDTETQVLNTYSMISFKYNF